MNRFFQIVISLFLLVLLGSCAKIASPAGGLRETTPPYIEKSKPINRSVNFNGRKLEITFDEFIKTDAIGQELVISPPLEERPQIRLRGKTLIIEWEEDLRDSATYTFSFGESIKDLNEGNVLRNFEFVFSTGGYLDSLSILGTVLDAFNLEPLEEPVSMMLYSNLADSAPLKEIPDYVGKSDKEGNFLINNLKPATYRIFALQDLNRNYMYDVPEEFIGFLDSSITLTAELFRVSQEEIAGLDSLPLRDSMLMSWRDTLALIDSLAWSESEDFRMVDSLLIEKDDSITLADLAPWSVFVDIFVFQEDNALQYLIDNTRKDRRNFTMYFNRRVNDTVLIEPYDFEASVPWYVFEEHVMNDTFVYWISDSLVYKRDSLTLLASYPVTDSLLNYITFYDTLKFNYREPKKEPVRKRKDKEELVDETEKISLTMSLKSKGTQNLNSPVTMEIQHPVALIDTTKIILNQIKDSLKIPVPYTLVHDAGRLRRYFLKADWKSLEKYQLDLFPSAFTDIYSLTHDTLSLSFSGRDLESYSRILLNLTGVDGQKIIQLLDTKGNVVRQKTSSSDGLIEFDFMDAISVTLKLIHDRNGNKKWDTGEYLDHLQPEMVLFYPGSLKLRANFDMEVNWNISEPNPEKPINK